MEKKYIHAGNHGDVYKFNEAENGIILNKVSKTVRIKNTNFLYEFLYTIQSFFPSYFQSKKSNYIYSYFIEYEFYKNQTEFIGVYLPKIYLSDKNLFMRRYQYIFEDVSSDILLTNQTIIKIIHSLANFHNNFFNKFVNYKVWNEGGYWTNNKRMINDNFFIKKYFSFKNNLIHLNIKFEEENVLSFILSKKEQINEYYKKRTTLIHGDFKLDNMFIKNDSIVLFDWQWVGYGNPATDIMYFIITSLSYDMINDYYIKYIINEYCLKFKHINFETLYIDFKIALFDFFKHLICFKWFDISEDTLKNNKINKKDGIHLQSKKQIKRICDLIYLYSLLDI